VCDDILITADGVERACVQGRAAIAGALDEEQPPAATGQTGEAIALAAGLLARARRVLVTGLANAALEAITVACDLAETLGAAIDDGVPEAARAAGPTIARAGEVTGVWEELRDRADLVVFWCCDPAESYPRFIERFVGPALADGCRRRTIAIGPVSGMPDAPTHLHIPLDRHLAVEAARLLQMRLSGRHMTPADTPLSAACAAVARAIQSARCVAIVTADADDPVGLEAWSIVHLTRTIAHEKPAFHVPLGGGLAAGGANVAGAAAACTWRYGAAGAIARADRMGSLFLPAESNALRLIDREEVDAVLVLGRLSGPLARAIACRGEGLSLICICDAAGAIPRPASRAIELRCAHSTIATSGTMLREDGRRVVLAPPRHTMAPQMRDVLVELTAAIREVRKAEASGGRP